MKLSTFLAIKAVISIVFGLGLLLIPAIVMDLFGVTLDAPGATMARFVGACLTGIGLICWLYKDARYEPILGILLALFVTDAAGFIVGLMAQLSGQMNSLGWIIVLLWLLLAVGLGYYRFMRPKPS